LWASEVRQGHSGQGKNLIGMIYEFDRQTAVAHPNTVRLRCVIKMDIQNVGVASTSAPKLPIFGWFYINITT